MEDFLYNHKLRDIVLKEKMKTQKILNAYFGKLIQDVSHKIQEAQDALDEYNSALIKYGKDYIIPEVYKKYKNLELKITSPKDNFKSKWLDTLIDLLDSDSPERIEKLIGETLQRYEEKGIVIPIKYDKYRNIK